MFKKILTLIIVAGFHFVSFAQEKESIPPDIFFEYTTKSDVVILDVRTKDEMKSGFISNAVNIDYHSPEFKKQVGELTKDKTYLVYCASGIRSDRALKIMKGMGFTKVHNLEGGLEAWKEKGFELKK